MIQCRYQDHTSHTISTKIRSFQYRLIHRIIGINAKLCRWGIKNSNLCDLCKSQEETYDHLFYKCGKVVPFWTSVKAWISVETDTNINFSSTKIIIGTPSDIPPIFDLYLTIAKIHMACP